MHLKTSFLRDRYRCDRALRGEDLNLKSACGCVADVVKVRMQLQTLQLASDGTRLVAPNLVSPHLHVPVHVSSLAFVKAPTL